MDASDPPGSPKRWMIFIGGMILAILLIVAGICLMFVDLANVPTAAVFGISLLCLAGSLWILGPLPSKNWAASLLLLALGIYGMGRGIGAIQLPWLTYLSGFACIVAAALVFSATLPGVNQTEN